MLKLRSIWLLFLFPVSGCGFPAAVPIDYQAIFVPDRLVDWKLTVNDQDLATLFQISDEYVEATVEVDTAGYERVGLRIMGGSDEKKPSFRVRFAEYNVEQRFHGVKTLELRGNASDPSLVREALALALMKEAGVPAPRWSFVWVTVNGGAGAVYTLVEHVDKKFLANRFGEKKGNLYKVERGGDFGYRGDSQESYPEASYELKTNEDVNDRSDLVELCRVLNQTPITNLGRELPKVLDTDGSLLLLAVNTWLSNMDSYAGAGGGLYAYHGADGRFRLIPWDLNKTFGNYHGKHCTLTTDDMLNLDPDTPTCGGERPLVTRMLDVPEFSALFHQQLGALIDGALNPATVGSRLGAIRALIQERAHEDQTKGCSNQQFDAAFTTDIPEGKNPLRIPGLLPFTEKRDSVVRRLDDLLRQ